jgi:hypothetical protein
VTHLLCHPQHCHAERSRSAAKQHSGVVEASLPETPARGGIPPFDFAEGGNDSCCDAMVTLKRPKTFFTTCRCPPHHRTPKLTVEPAVTF